MKTYIWDTETQKYKATDYKPKPKSPGKDGNLLDAMDDYEFEEKGTFLTQFF